MHYLSKRPRGVHISELEAKNVTLTGTRGWRDIWKTSDEIFSSQDDNQLSQMYSKVELVYACVRELTTSASAIPLTVGKQGDEGFEEYEGSAADEALGLFYENEYYSYEQMLQLIIDRLSLNGASFSMLELYKNRAGIARVVPMPTQTVDVLARGPAIEGYEIQTDAKEPMFMKPEEVMSHMYLNPANYQSYLSPLQAAAKRLTIDIEQANMSAEMMVNQSLPGMIGRMNGQLKEAQIQQIKDQLHSGAGGANASRGKLFLVPNTVEDLQATSVKDIDQDVLSGLTETRICMVYGVPPILIGAKVGLDASTYSNYGQARTSFYEETLVPLLSFIQGQFTRMIFRAQGENELEYKFDLSNVKELQKDSKVTTENAVELYSAGIIDRNEARDLVGFDAEDLPEPAPEAEKKPVIVPMPKPEEAEQEEVGKTANPFLGKLVAKATPVIDEFEDSAELEREIKKEFRRQEKEAQKQFDKVGIVQMALIAAAFNPKVQTTLASGYERNVRKTVLGLYDFDAAASAVDIASPLAAARAQVQFEQMVAATTQTTQTIVDKAIADTRRRLAADGIYGSQSTKDLTDAIAGAFKDSERWRAQRIAVTESSRMVSDASVIAANGSDVVGWVPLVSMDACDYCQQFDAEGNATGNPRFPYTSQEDAMDHINQSTTTEAAYTNRTLPPFHPNCRCDKQAIFASDLASMKLPPSKTELPSIGRQTIPSEVPVKDLVK